MDGKRRLDFEFSMCMGGRHQACLRFMRLTDATMGICSCGCHPENDYLAVIANDMYGPSVKKPAAKDVPVPVTEQ